jgi:hypothetical protein
MGKFDSDRSSPGGASTFKSGPSGIRKHAGSHKRHASEAPTGKYGFARLKNDDSGDAEAGSRHEVGGGGQSRALSVGGGKKNKNKAHGSGQEQVLAATSVRSALKHVAVENLVAGGAKKSKLLQKVYDSDAFSGAWPMQRAARPLPQMHTIAPFSSPVTGLASMTATQRLQLFWVAATSMRDSPASGLAAPSPDVFRCFPNRFLFHDARITRNSLQYALRLFVFPLTRALSVLVFSRSGASVAEAVVGFLDQSTLKQHSSPAGSCSPIAVVLCMTSDCVNSVATALRSAAPRALVGKMYGRLPVGVVWSVACRQQRALCVPCPRFDRT